MVWTNEALLDCRFDMCRMVAGEDLEPHVPQTAWAITQADFIAQVPVRQADIARPLSTTVAFRASF